MQVRPLRGGFLRPFGCGWFIREFLLGHGPEGSPKIDPEKGACQEDIFYQYKLALHRAFAENEIEYENDERIKAGKQIYTPEEYQERLEWYLQRIPYKLVKCRYHSFIRYFHLLKQLGWVEPTGQEEKSTIQENVESSGSDFEAPSRIYYRLTREGIEADDTLWSNPLIACYPQIGGIPAQAYFKEKRQGRIYIRKKTRKSRA